MTINITDQSPKTYVVLGMHQGGTSFISKALHDQGVKMGITEKGVYENLPFVQLNNELLQKAGGSWHTPPTREKIKFYANGMKDKIVNTITNSKAKFWGFKDPRTALTTEAYLPHLEDDVYLVCVFRKPRKVAMSIERVGHFDRNRAYDLTKTYYNRIIETIKEFAEL